MKNRLLLNGLLLLFLVALSLFIWLKPNTGDKKNQLISQLTTDAVHTINIHRADKPDIQLTKKDKKWEMTAPYSAEVAASKISLLLTLLSEPIKSEYSAQGKDLTQFGLDPEQTSIQFNTESKMIFGISHPVSYDRYVLKDNKILLISETVAGAMKADVASFFSTQLVPKGSQIRNITLPENYKLADDTIANWQLGSAIQVFDWDKEKQPSQGSVKIELGNGEQIIYEIIETSPELLLGNSKLNAKYQMAEENTQGLLPPR